jgi:hypothetical protein
MDNINTSCKDEKNWVCFPKCIWILLQNILPVNNYSTIYASILLIRESKFKRGLRHFTTDDRCHEFKYFHSVELLPLKYHFLTTNRKVPDFRKAVNIRNLIYIVLCFCFVCLHLVSDVVSFFELSIVDCPLGYSLTFIYRTLKTKGKILTHFWI